MDNDEHTGPFNIGNPGEFTMSELAEVVKSIIDPDAKIEFRENTADDPGRRKPDITKAKELLGWEPKVTLKQARPSIRTTTTCTRASDLSSVLFIVRLDHNVGLLEHNLVLHYLDHVTEKKITYS